MSTAVDIYRGDQFEVMTRAAKALAASKYFKDADDVAKAMVKIMAGRELGLGPFASMTGIHIISGKPVLGANIIATLIKNDPRYDYRVTQHTDSACVIEFYEDGKPVGVSPFDMDDARAAGVLNNPTWKKYPRNMLFARAISNGARWYTPGIFGGAAVYTPDEMGADFDEDGGVVVEDAPEPSTNGHVEITHDDVAELQGEFEPVAPAVAVAAKNDNEQMVMNAITADSFGGFVTSRKVGYNHGDHVMATVAKMVEAGTIAADDATLDTPAKRLNVYRALVARKEQE